MAEGVSGQVLQIVPNDHPPFGNVCATYRLALESLGLDVRTLSLSPPFAEPLPDVTYLGLTELKDVRRAGRVLREALEDFRPLLAICHRYRAYRILRASGLAVPRVVTVAHEFGFFRRLQRRLERKLFAGNVMFAGVSPSVQAELGEVVADPLCLPNALDVEAFEARSLDRKAARELLGVPADDTFTVGFVGRLVDKKHPALAVEAIRAVQAAASSKAVRLVVIGDGPLRSELESLATDLPVTFCGFIPDARCLFRALDALLLTSEDVEAFGMVALEAMVSRVPVVAGPAPGPQFVLGSTGYYYTQREPRRVAEILLAVEEERAAGNLDERLDRGYQRAVREFSIAALAGRLDDLFFRGVGR
jgi:glycosyltransferase involved in cell wall biosynthesis